MQDDKIKYIQVNNAILKQFHLEVNDVLFNRVNSEEFVGRTGIFRLSGEYLFASYLIRLRVKNNSEILPNYLNIFLNSSYGKKQIQKFLRRAVNQANVNAEELKNFRIAVLPNDLQAEVSKLSDNAWGHIELSKSLYTQAENLILDNLGLKDFKSAFEVFYSANLSNVFESHRMDAEYFQPAYKKLKEYLDHAGCCSIKEIEEFNGRGVQPRYVPNGDIKVVISKRLGRRFIEYENLETTTLEEWMQNPNARIKQGDILTYATGAYVGRTNCFMKGEKALASNHVNILRVRDLDQLFVGVYLNSIVGQLQVNRHVSGSTQVELYPSDIAKILVWKASKQIQDKVAWMVTNAYEAKMNSAHLLEKAKALVEQEIDNYYDNS